MSLDAEDKRSRSCMGHKAVSNLLFWMNLTGSPEYEWVIVLRSPDVSIDTGTEDIGYSGTLNRKNLRLGVPGTM